MGEIRWKSLVSYSANYCNWTCTRSADWFYQHDLKTESLSHTDLCTLLAPDNELGLLAMLQETGVIAKEQQWKFCGDKMHFHKQGNTWYLICTRRVDGVKCNRGKFAVRDGTFFGNSHLPIDTIVWIVWHYYMICQRVSVNSIPTLASSIKIP